MKGTAIIYTAGKPIPDVEEMDNPPSLYWLKEKIGGYLEQVPGFTTIKFKGERRRCVAFCDEEGKLKGKPFNSLPTILWAAAAYPVDDVLVGNVVVLLGDDEFMESL